MKVKTDFVSNSSTTSFIYISNVDFDKHSFFKAIGVSENSPMLLLFEKMYDILNGAIRTGEIVLDENQLMQDIYYHVFTPEIIERAKKALKKGNKVVIGGLSSDECGEETYLCTEIFEIESDDFYINAFNNYW
jgi:hypothetical protein